VGFFDFFKKPSSESDFVRKLYSNLKGIDFDSINVKPAGAGPESFFDSDIDGEPTL
tara:strand:+ start:1020 stop:1187 length:168 start_codon:yes stop_codon:yes gene_type:complete